MLTTIRAMLALWKESLQAEAAAARDRAEQAARLERLFEERRDLLERSLRIAEVVAEASKAQSEASASYFKALTAGYTAAGMAGPETPPPAPFEGDTPLRPGDEGFFDLLAELEEEMDHENTLVRRG